MLEACSARWRLTAWLASAALAGCGPSLLTIATQRAQRELGCGRPDLRVRANGELRARAAGRLRTVVLFEASGCEREQLYVCASETRRCEPDFSRLPWLEARAAFEREHGLLRQVARARCPEAELRVTQESESLFRYDACDGSWLYHCRARGCQRLPARHRD